MSKKIIITGVDGMLGKAIRKKIENNGYSALMIGSNDLKHGELCNKGNLYVSYKKLNHKELTTLFVDFQPNIFIHLAAFSTASDDFESLQNLIASNIDYLARNLDALKECKLDVFIYTGTCTEFKHDAELIFDPAYLYSATKAAGRNILEYYSKAYGFKIVNIIPYTIYGGVDKNKKVIDFLFDSLNSKTPMDLTMGEQMLDFIHVDDVVDLYLKVVENIENIEDNSFLYAGTGIGHTIKDVVGFLELKTGKKANINWGGKKYRNRDVMKAVANIGSNFLQWKPQISLSEGIDLILSNKNRD